MRLEAVHQNHIPAIWPNVEGFLAEAMTHSAGEYTLEQLKVYLVTGVQVLLVLVDDNDRLRGAAAIATETYPNACVAFVTAIGGRDIARSEHFAKLADWCRQRGYTCIRGAAFEAVARLWRRQFQAKEIYRVVEIPL